MTQMAPIMSSWNGGELSPLMSGRVDTKIYAIGAAIMENFAPMIEGPVQKCPGFERIRAAASTATWLTTFVFNQTQGYVIEGSEGKARFYTNGGRIESGPTAPYEVTVPYTAADWPRVRTQQSYDVLYMVDGEHPQGRLARTSATTFAYAALDLKNGPFKDGNGDETITVSVSGGSLAEGASVTVSASAAIFAAGHVGALFQVEAKDFSTVEAWQVGIDSVTIGTKRRSDGKVYVAATAGTTGQIAPTHDEGSAWDGSSTGKDVNGKGPYGVRWTYLHDRFGIVRITAVAGDGLSATATVIRRVPDSLASVASWRWAHAAFSNAEGWPNLVAIWNGRLCFWKGVWLYGSVVGDYANFQAYTSAGYLAADLAFRMRLASSDEPLWVKVDRVMLVGTAREEWAIGPLNAAAGVAGDNIKAEKQSRYGSADVVPVEAGTDVIYVQRGGRQFRAAQYSFGTDRYESPNLNRWARHIARPRVVQLAVQQLTEELVLGVRSDGQLVMRSYDPEQEIKGFARRVLGQGGKVLSAVVIPNEDASRDDVWALCQWGSAKSVQKMADWWEVDAPGSAGMALKDAMFVDDAISQTLESPSATITGLDWLVGASASILADGVVVPPIMVPPSGTITLPFAAKVRTVGRGYRAQLKILPPELRDPTGQSATGKIKRLVWVVLRLLASAGVKLKTNVREQDMLDRPISAPMDAPPPLFTGDTQDKQIGGEPNRQGDWSVVSDDPLPLILAAAMPRYEVSDK